MKIIITGSSGFVGQNLLQYFNNNVTFQCINRNDWPLISTENLSNAAAVVHLAGKAHDIRKVANPKDYYKINFELTKKIYDIFIKSDIPKFIFISTVKAVADNLTEILTENYDPDPQTDYGKSKLMAENYIISKPLPQGKSCYILRPCMIHGPGNKGNLNLLYKFISKGLPYPLAAFKNKRSFLSVQNLCFIIKEFIDRNDIPIGVYNVADDESLSTNDVVKLISQVVHKSPNLLYIPKKLIIFVARIGDWLKLPLNTDTLEKLTNDFIVSNKKVGSVLKKKLPLSSREGITITIQSFDK